MITNRKRDDLGFEDERDALTFWTSDGGDLGQLASWKQNTADSFKAALIQAAGQFPLLTPSQNEDQKHVNIFIHGYNNTWQASVATYQEICSALFDGERSLGICVLFSWPSDGLYLGYYPDRIRAEESAPDLSTILNELYDWMLAQQKAGIEDPSKRCRAKTSVIAHSMGDYLLQKAMAYTWTRKYQPLLVSLINQLLMVAADVDNDLFKSGEAIEKSDGDAIANLTYRVTALFTGRDPVLGLSAGLKHFGKRRLGRSGLDLPVPAPDNVWEVDCSSLIPANSPDVHSAYFEAPETLELMRQVLRGVDRGVLASEGLAPQTPEAI